MKATCESTVYCYLCISKQADDTVTSREMSAGEFLNETRMTQRSGRNRRADRMKRYGVSRCNATMPGKIMSVPRGVWPWIDILMIKKSRGHHVSRGVASRRDCKEATVAKALMRFHLDGRRCSSALSANIQLLLGFSRSRRFAVSRMTPPSGCRAPSPGYNCQGNGVVFQSLLSLLHALYMTCGMSFHSGL